MRRWYPAFAGVPLPSFFFVARMERSEIRERQTGGTAAPDFAALHPGYETKNGRTKGRPHPWLSFDQTGFALDVTLCWRAIRSCFARTIKLGCDGAPRGGSAWPCNTPT